MSNSIFNTYKSGSHRSAWPDGRPAPARPFWARLALASLIALIVSGGHAGAAGARHERTQVAIETRPMGAPVMAIVSLRGQTVTVYDADGWIMRAPVSSGQPGRETPAGVFSIIEKQAEHYSNLYDDASMPHMERITWSGIALHGGPLPGYAASHGCVRMPYDFASRLFDKTKRGMRVIIAPDDVAPVEIAHPALFKSKPGAGEEAAARATEAAEAASKADQAKREAAAAARDAAQTEPRVHTAEALKRKADARLAAAERKADRAVALDRSDDALQRAEEARAEASEAVAAADAQADAARAEQQQKSDAASAARQASLDAETRRAEAVDASRKAARALEPASVFISRKTQRLYVRQGFQPVLEAPVTIKDPDRPIGTYVFTAVRIQGATDLQWTVVPLEGDIQNGSTTGADGAKAALDRITIPPDVADRIAGMMHLRSSVIVSDEALSPETGKGTEFIVVMSDEPQGGIKFRRRPPIVTAERREFRPEGRSPWGGSPFGIQW